MTPAVDLSSLSCEKILEGRVHFLPGPRNYLEWLDWTTFDFGPIDLWGDPDDWDQWDDIPMRANDREYEWEWDPVGAYNRRQQCESDAAAEHDERHEWDWDNPAGAYDGRFDGFDGFDDGGWRNMFRFDQRSPENSQREPEPDIDRPENAEGNTVCQTDANHGDAAHGGPAVPVQGSSRCTGNNDIEVITLDSDDDEVQVLPVMRNAGVGPLVTECNDDSVIILDDLDEQEEARTTAGVQSAALSVVAKRRSKGARGSEQQEDQVEEVNEILSIQKADGRSSTKTKRSEIPLTSSNKERGLESCVAEKKQNKISVGEEKDVNSSAAKEKRKKKKRSKSVGILRKNGAMNRECKPRERSGNSPRSQSLPRLASVIDAKTCEDVTQIRQTIRKRSKSDATGELVRVRRLSETGRREQIFPIYDRQLESIWNFKGFKLIENRAHAAAITNIRNCCFAIAVMQTLVHTAPFVRLILEKHDHGNGRAMGQAVLCRFCGVIHQTECICCDIKHHMLRVLKVKSPKNHSVDWVYGYWKKLYNARYHRTQEDPHEFLLKLLPLVDKCYYAALSYGRIPKGPSPPTVQMFGFKIRYQLICLTCGNCTVNYAFHYDIALHLPPYSKKNAGARPLKIHTLLSSYMKDEILDYKCPEKKCGGKRAKRIPFILRAPSVLILQIQRFNCCEQKNPLEVEVEEHLSLKDFTYPQLDDDYELTSIISHEGRTLEDGHFIAVVRGYDRQFYYYDDAYVGKRQLWNLRLCPYLVVYSRTSPEKRFFDPPPFKRATKSKKRGYPGKKNNTHRKRNGILNKNYPHENGHSDASNVSKKPRLI